MMTVLLIRLIRKSMMITWKYEQRRKVIRDKLIFRWKEEKHSCFVEVRNGMIRVSLERWILKKKDAFFVSHSKHCLWFEKVYKTDNKEYKLESLKISENYKDYDIVDQRSLSRHQ